MYVCVHDLYPVTWYKTGEVFSYPNHKEKGSGKPNWLASTLLQQCNLKTFVPNPLKDTNTQVDITTVREVLCNNCLSSNLISSYYVCEKNELHLPDCFSPDDVCRLGTILREEKRINGVFFCG